MFTKKQWLNWNEGILRKWNGRNVLIASLALLFIVGMVFAWQHQRGISQSNLMVSSITNEGGSSTFSFAALKSANPASVTPRHSAANSLPPSGQVSQQSQNSNHMIIETANLTIMVQSVEAVQRQIGNLAVISGGYVQSTEQYGTNSSPTVSMQIRVPAKVFSSVLKTLEGKGKVTVFSQNGQDVTQEYQSNASQLVELRAQSSAYTRLFGKAKSMKDMLTIEQALIQVQSQISNLLHQQHDITRAVSLSTIDIQLIPSVFSNAAPTPIVSTWNQILSTLGQSTLGIVTIIAWVLPWAVLFAILFVLLRVIFTKKGQR